MQEPAVKLPLLLQWYRIGVGLDGAQDLLVDGR